MRLPFFKNGAALGVARGKRSYDLPLNRSAGSNFLVLLISLMTVLAMLALAASFALSEMTARWSAGLEGRLTIEIPAEGADGKLLDPAAVKSMAGEIAVLMRSHPAVKEAEVMSEDDIRALLSPWLGEDLAMDTIPLPGLISVTLQDSADVNFTALAQRIRAVAPEARIDTHQSWLADVLRFTGALQFTAALIMLVIGLTTVFAVAGGVRARMAVHRDELELLHLMGANDAYISRQLQRHMLILALQGGAAGAVLAAGMMAVIGWMSGRMDISLLPDFSLDPAQLALLGFMPVGIALIGAFTARLTALQALAAMP